MRDEEAGLYADQCLYQREDGRFLSAISKAAVCRAVRVNNRKELPFFCSIRRESYGRRRVGCLFSARRRFLAAASRMRAVSYWINLTSAALAASCR